MDRWQVIKNHVPIAVLASIEEAEKVYMEFDADEIRRIPEEKAEEA